jgi:predicted secreted hydrolase
MNARVVKKAAVLAAVLLTMAAFRPALPGYHYQFPRDHASHPDFQTEWWYYTGHLKSGDRWFGYELTFFRVGIDSTRAPARSAWIRSVQFAHLALTDEAGHRFSFDQRISRPALGLAGADTARYRVWVEDWSAALDADGITHRLHASTAAFGLDLSMRPDKPVVIHGVNGVSQKSAGLGRASHYLSFTRMTTHGRIRVGADTLAVTGTTWMDHEFGSNQLGGGQVGWDWFAIQLDDGRELMLYRLRRANGTVEPMSSGTWVAAGGAAAHLPLSAFEITSDRSWKSSRTGADYPARWRIRVPSRALELELEPVLADQELVLEGPVGVRYWEGSVRVTGREGDQPISGRGYVELTGYAGRVPGF